MKLRDIIVFYDNMIRLAYCNVENLNLKNAYDLVSKNRQEKIDFYRFEKDKKLSAGAYLLLKNYCRKKTSQIQSLKLKNTARHTYPIMKTFILI